MKTVLDIFYYGACIGIIYSLVRILILRKNDKREEAARPKNFLKDELIHIEIRILIGCMILALVSLFIKNFV